MKRFILLSGMCLLFLLNHAQQKALNYEPEIIGNTFYDLQTWRAMQNRLHVFEDGSAGLVWNSAWDSPGLPSIGVGYGYYDGNQWNGPIMPGQSITSGWSVFPSYTPFGENGELCFSQGESGLIMSYRNEKGTGDWNETYMPGTNFRHPCVVGSGVDHSVLQLLCLYPDPDFAGSYAQPERGPILYCRSADGGQTWNPENTIIEGLGPDYYAGFTIGAYAWAEPRFNTIAFVAGDFHTDLILMKSTDGGDSWQKTVIWEHPYPFFELGTFNSDTFYCNDGGISVALDDAGKAHVAFSLTRVYSSLNQDSAWYVKGVDGVVYWNEDRETFSGNINSLNPYSHPDSELIEDYNLIGWSPDVDGNGQISLLNDYGTYPTPGLSTMTQITIKDDESIFVTWSSVTETYQIGESNLRHIWARMSPDDGNYWGNFSDLNNDLIFIFSEIVYPAVSRDTDMDYLFLSFQEDGFPGLSGPEPPYSQNNIWFFPGTLGWNPVTVHADFTCDTTIVPAGGSIQFLNLSTGYPPDQITYEWEFEGGIPSFSADVDPVVLYPEQGIFDVKLTASILPMASNEKIEEDYIEVWDPIGIHEEDHSGIRIFPNPATGEFSISFAQQIDCTIRIMDQQGKIIMEFNQGFAEPNITIDLNSHPGGMYIIELTTNEGIIRQKIILQ